MGNNLRICIEIDSCRYVRYIERDTFIGAKCGVLHREYAATLHEGVGGKGVDFGVLDYELAAVLNSFGGGDATWIVILVLAVFDGEFAVNVDVIAKVYFVANNIKYDFYVFRNGDWIASIKIADSINLVARTCGSVDVVLEIIVVDCSFFDRFGDCFICVG